MLKIFWFRKDLRLQDNRGLKSFLESLNPSSKFSFIYIKNNSGYEYYGEKRISFLYQSLSYLKNQLNELSFDLNIFYGNSYDIFKYLTEKYGVLDVYANEQFEPYSINRDNKILNLFKHNGSSLKLFYDTTLFNKNEILKDNNEPYTVFTPFKNKCLKQITGYHYDSSIVNFNLIKDFTSGYIQLSDKSIPKINNTLIFKGDRNSGLNALKDFYNNKITSYKNNRDYPSLKGTSMLSPYIHFGLISIRECWRAALKKLSEYPLSDDITTWQNELLWREFYYHIAFNFPDIINSSFKTQYDILNWNNNQGHFIKWCNGETGYPIIDAAMVQLNETGWMHNRLRMLTAMFLTKDLFIDWRKGEKYFAKHLIDFDFCSNNGGWQWSASTGCDAQPYFRIFNPETQSKKFDSQGQFIKKYLPVLKDIPAKYIHKPSLMPSALSKSINLIIGKDYPLPVIEHSVARNYAILQYKSVNK